MTKKNLSVYFGAYNFRGLEPVTIKAADRHSMGTKTGNSPVRAGREGATRKCSQ